MPQNLLERYLGFTNGDTVVHTAGSGFLNTARFDDGTGLSNQINFGSITSNLGFTRPVAVAGYSHGGTDVLLLAYEKATHTGFSLSSPIADIGLICYRISLNGGVSFGAESCPGNVTSFFGLTATYDAYSNAYLIGYVDNSTLDIAVLTIPSDSNVSTPVATTVLATSTLHAPSIACNGSANGCKIAYEAYNETGNLSWLNVSVDPSTGSVGLISNYTSGWIMMDAPSIAFDPGDASYKVAYTLENSRTYTYSMSGNTLTGTGDAFSNASAFISSPLIHIRKFSGGTYGEYDWFLHYW